MKTMSQTKASGSEAYKRMRRTKSSTIVGAAIIVFSSSMLYINVILQQVSGSKHSGSRFWIRPWLNFLVFGINMNSILNDFGMMLASGTIRKMSNEGKAYILSKIPSMAPAKVYNEPPLAIEGQSYEGNMSLLGTPPKKIKSNPEDCGACSSFLSHSSDSNSNYSIDEAEAEANVRTGSGHAKEKYKKTSDVGIGGMFFVDLQIQE